MVFLHSLQQEPNWVNSVRFSPRKLLFKSEAKLVEVSVTLLMGSQSFCSDPYPPFHPLSRQTVHDCPWLLLWCSSLMGTGSLLVWPSVDSSLRAPNLSCLLLSPVWRQGHQVITGLGMGARPPVGGLLVILHCSQEEMAFRFRCLETVLWKMTLPAMWHQFKVGLSSLQASQQGLATESEFHSLLAANCKRKSVTTGNM